MLSFNPGRTLGLLATLLLCGTNQPNLLAAEEVLLHYDGDATSASPMDRGQHEVAVRFTASQLAPLVGRQLRAISFYLHELPFRCEVKIYRGQRVEPQAWSQIRAGALLIDVRTPAEFAQGHLAGAINIPHGEIATRIDALGDDSSRQIVLYCASGRRAGLAEDTLIALGFMQVLNAGGYLAMQQHAEVAAAPRTLLYASEITDQVSSPGWNTHLLENPLAITTEELWIGIALVHLSSFSSLGSDSGPAVEDVNWYLSVENSIWQVFAVDKNWHIRAILAYPLPASALRPQTWGRIKQDR